MKPVKVTTDDKGKTTCELLPQHRRALADAKTVTVQIVHYEPNTPKALHAALISEAVTKLLDPDDAGDAVKVEPEGDDAQA